MGTKIQQKLKLKLNESHKAKLYSFCHNRNLPLAIEETMAAIVHKIQLLCLSHLECCR